ncbi:MAG: hypothetical protein K2M47_05600 [Clostridiales bacterium]|nr:hypothetical protein [Clostridiales bacterium]
MSENYAQQSSAKKLNMVFFAAAILVAFIALCMLFAPAITIVGVERLDGSAAQYTGWEVSFGFSEYAENGVAQYYTMPSANMITYFAIIIGIVFSILAYTRKLGKIAYIIAFIAFAYAALGFVLTTAFTSYGPLHVNMIDGYTTSTFIPYCERSGGTIAGIIFSVFAALFHCVAWKASTVK